MNIRQTCLLALFGLCYASFVSHATGATTTQTFGPTGSVFRDAPLLVTRTDVDSGFVGVTSTSPGRVLQNADLVGFVGAKMKHDERIVTIQTSNRGVLVTYRESGLLFGRIPISVPVTSSTDSAGNTNIHYPWFQFVVFDSGEGLYGRLENHLRAADSPAEYLDAAHQAHLIDAVTEAMSEQYVVDSTRSAKI